MWTTLSLILVAIVGFIIWIYRWSNRKQTYWKDLGIPSFPSDRLPSQWERLKLKTPFHELDLKSYQLMKELGYDYCGTVEFQAPLLFVSDLEAIKSVMVKDFDTWVNRRNVDLQKSDPLFSKMLTQTKGQQWKDLRSTLSPTFTTGKIRRMYSMFNDSSLKMAKYIESQIQKIDEQSSASSNEIEFRDCFTRYTMDVISSVAFGLESETFRTDKEPEFCVMGKKFQNFFSGWWAMLKILFSLVFPKLYQNFRIPLADSTATNFFAGVIKNTIRHRLETGEKRNDFLQLLIETAAEEEAAAVEMVDEKNVGNKIKLTEDLILSQSLLFFIAGFDTIETLLLFAAYELALNPEIQEKLYEEINAAAISNNGELSYDIVMKLDYLDQVISETLRRYPPGIRTERQSIREYTLHLPNSNSNVALEKETTIAIPIYGIHHDPEYYPDPFKFCPERFSMENKANRHPFAYMPFGMGPRNCIASRFALAEGKSAVAHLIWKFQLEPGSKTHIPMKFSTTTVFKPEGGMWLTAKPRKK